VQINPDPAHRVSRFCIHTVKTLDIQNFFRHTFEYFLFFIVSSGDKTEKTASFLAIEKP